MHCGIVMLCHLRQNVYVLFGGNDLPFLPFPQLTKLFFWNLRSSLLCVFFNFDFEFRAELGSVLCYLKGAQKLRMAGRLWLPAWQRYTCWGTGGTTDVGWKGEMLLSSVSLHCSEPGFCLFPMEGIWQQGSEKWKSWFSTYLRFHLYIISQISIKN